MNEDKPYSRQATRDSQALIVYLLDISKSMGRPMTSGMSRLEVVVESLRQTVTTMTQRSLKQGKISPRYRLAVFAYSDELYDLYDGIQTINVINNEGIPSLTPQNRTNTAMAFKYALKLLKDDLSQWTEEDQRWRPAPLVVHMTDGELNEISEDPAPLADSIRQLKVKDGNVLIENILISDEIAGATSDIHSWPGYFPGKDLGNPYGNKLLQMSSPLPETYRLLINGHQGLQIQSGAALMFPGITPQFVREAFVMNAVSSSILILVIQVRGRV